MATRFHPNYLFSPAGPVEGSWGSWRPWSSCSKTCGGGTQTRGRLCDSPAPVYGGGDCRGDQSQEKQCNTHSCVPDNTKIFDIHVFR